jgi:rare lipoprotein A
VASWYGKQFHGRKTASGRRYNMYEMTAAHTTLPTGTQVKVTNLHNGRTIIVTITDRGPFAHNRIIDLSYAAAKQLGFVGQGTARVRVIYYRAARKS